MSHFAVGCRFYVCCLQAVSYRACVPLESRTNEPGGEYRHDMQQKDEFIRLWYERIMAERLRHESNERLESEGLNELGEGGWIVQRVHPDAGSHQFHTSKRTSISVCEQR